MPSLEKNPSSQLANEIDPKREEFWMDVMEDPFMENPEPVQEEIFIAITTLSDSVPKLTKKQSKVLQ